MSKKILIAEDDGFMAKILANKLKEGGYEVEVVNNGKEALDKTKKDSYNLVLTDLIMPTMDGFELLKNLKEADYKAPVFVFTNLSQPEDEEEVMKLGAKGYLSKSTPLEELLVLIEKNAE